MTTCKTKVSGDVREMAWEDTLVAPVLWNNSAASKRYQRENNWIIDIKSKTYLNVVRPLQDQNVAELWIKGAKTWVIQQCQRRGSCWHRTLWFVRPTSIGNNERLQKSVSYDATEVLLVYIFTQHGSLQAIHKHRLFTARSLRRLNLVLMLDTFDDKGLGTDIVEGATWIYGINSVSEKIEEQETNKPQWSKSIIAFRPKKL